MITQRIVPENERFEFYPSITKKYIHFEVYSYLLAKKYIADYSQVRIRCIMLNKRY